MKNLVDEVGYATNFSIDDIRYHFIQVKNMVLPQSIYPERIKKDISI